MKEKVLVAQSCLTLCYPMDCSPPSSSVHGILQAGILEWESIPASRGSSRPRDGSQTDSLPSEPPGKPNLLQKCLLWKMSNINNESDIINFHIFVMQFWQLSIYSQSSLRYAAYSWLVSGKFQYRIMSSINTVAKQSKSLKPSSGCFLLFHLLVLDLPPLIWSSVWARMVADAGFGMPALVSY